MLRLQERSRSNTSVTTITTIKKRQPSSVMMAAVQLLRLASLCKRVVALVVPVLVKQ